MVAHNNYSCVIVRVIGILGQTFLTRDDFTFLFEINGEFLNK